MVYELSNAPFYHINSNANFSPYDLMRLGQQIEIGNQSCPFFRIYETWTRTYPVRTPEGGVEDVAALTYLERIRSGSISLDDPGSLKVTSVEIARHFMMLARELVWENIRITEFPDAPSRQRCIWLISQPERVTDWIRSLRFQPGTYWVVKVLASGKALDVDGRLLAGDSEPLPTWQDKARRYWRGEFTPNSLPETLFEGTLRVAEILEPTPYHPKA